MKNSPILIYLDEKKEYIPIKDASVLGLGAILCLGKHIYNWTSQRKNRSLGAISLSLQLSVVYRTGTSNPADYLSRFPWESISQTKEQIYQISLRDLLNNSNTKNKSYKHYDSSVIEKIKQIHNKSHRNYQETNRVLKEVHGIDGMGALVKDIVAECELCQRVNYSERKASLMNIVEVNNPFSVWGIDVAGPIPESKNLKNKYIIVDIDYYAKWRSGQVASR
ncbi:hypothetical protein AYI69_g3725 [Smittium culicis]|uniref:Integrase zinc-binding domain-containing protein n=1 Tax=Smittium culicis TaxID=133412 RepID=A0A1R1YJ00_9FUNG|nr:hypothetical protein AYI69_g3725 [Smittium culicis]